MSTHLPTNWETFPNAPILEAVIDLQVRPRPGLVVDDLLPLADALSETYPVRREQGSWTAQVELNPVHGSSVKPVESKAEGFWLQSKDELSVLQAHLGRLTMSRRRPYVGWSAFREEAVAAWSLYLDVAAPTHVYRIGVRYINELRIPMPTRGLREYVLSGPVLDENVDASFTGFFLRSLLVDNQTQANGIVVLGTGDVQADGSLAILFDIDVYLSEEVEASDASIWERVELLRQFKNRIFFESLTERAKELFR